ncbi:MAG: xanthine dehydrogenase family protein subunit M [Granulosicoccus sp.]|nr:xanthine dehydrogenase family protein subunit M [Granulosicoccus sp.]
MSNRQLRSLSSALEELSRSAIPVLAGGTDFYPALRDAPAPDRVLDVTRIAGLQGVEKTAGGWRFGALSTWTDILNEPLPPAFDGLKAAAREVGSVQIQNAATLAGNLCNASPAADGVPPLLCLDASVELASVRGTRILPLDQFILAPRSTALASDELMIAINVPSISDHAISGFSKLGARRYLVISIVMACITLEADEQDRLVSVRISVGACSAVATRLRKLEHVLLGQSIQDDLVSLVTPALLSGLNPLSDVRGSADYRLIAAGQMIGRLLASGLHTLLHGRRQPAQCDDTEVDT